MDKKIAIAAGLLVSLVSLACTKNSEVTSGNPDVKPAAFCNWFAFENAQISVEEENTASLQILVTREQTAGKPETISDGLRYDQETNTLGILFSSRSEAVAKVSSKGVVTAVAPGMVYIVAESSVSGQKDSVFVTVTKMDDAKAGFRHAEWNWRNLTKGARYGSAQMTLFDSAQTISILTYPEEQFSTELVYNPGTSCVVVPEAAKAVDAVLAINGSYFTSSLTSSVTHWDSVNKTINRASGWEQTDRSTGLIGFKDGKMTFSHCSAELESRYFTSWCRRFDAFISAGPLLRVEGTVVPVREIEFNQLRHPRSMIGIDAARTVYMVVVDGRFSGKAVGATMKEMAQIADWLNLTDAINLDGGGSSTLWSSAAGVINHPCDNATYDHEGCRRCPTVIVAK